MNFFQALKDARCRRFLRRKGIKFSPSLQALGVRAELVLEGGVVLRNVAMGYSHLEVGAMTYIRGESELWNVSRIGRFCSIGNGVLIGHDRAGHPMDWVSTHPFSHAIERFHYPPTVGPAQIGHDVWIGREAMVLEGVEVGTGAVIAARAIVTKDVPPYAIVAGAPARIVRYRHSPQVIQGLLASQWWQWPVEQLRSLSLDKPEVFLEEIQAVDMGEAMHYPRVSLRRSGWHELIDK